jgi:hypothetical protein
MLGTPRYGAGQRQRTALAAPTTRRDLACSGLRQDLSAGLIFSGAVQCQKTAGATSSTSSSIGSGLREGGSNEMIRAPVVVCSLIRFRGRGTSLSFFGDNL